LNACAQHTQMAAIVRGRGHLVGDVPGEDPGMVLEIGHDRQGEALVVRLVSPVDPGVVQEPQPGVGYGLEAHRHSLADRVAIRKASTVG